jgi:hypothetical protein
MARTLTCSRSRCHGQRQSGLYIVSSLDRCQTVERAVRPLVAVIVLPPLDDAGRDLNARELAVADEVELPLCVATKPSSWSTRAPLIEVETTVASAARVNS